MIKPIEKEKNNNQKAVVFKILFLLSLIITGILLDRLFLVKKSTLSSTSEILGEEKHIEKPKESFINDTLNSAGKKIEELGEQVLGETTQFVKNTQEKIASSVSQVIYKTSLEPIVNQFEKLPEDQKQRVKKEICK
ncbi:MAG: hypothetical protein KatS3mg092_0613 [Patescibacteria group bacterium]|nr:MAG: hypothetical protein KatS3mg092_0613 [Patescibacteria group bacterium]